MRPVSINSRGMTLIEAITAVVIFSIAAIMLLSGFLTMLRINRKSRDILTATSRMNLLAETAPALEVSRNVTVRFADGASFTVPGIAQEFVYNGADGTADGYRRYRMRLN